MRSIYARYCCRRLSVCLSNACIVTKRKHLAKKVQLENVAIANALQLKARRRAVPIRLNFVARAKFEVAQPVRCRLRAFLLLIRHVTLWSWTLTPWPWPLTSDLEHLWWAGYTVVKLCTKFKLNRAIRSGVIAVWTLTLWSWACITCSRYAVA